MSFWKLGTSAGQNQSMMDEGPTGPHYIQLTSTILRRVGVGIYADPNGWAWFTEDLVS